MNNTAESNERSALIVGMERRLNSSWFNRRAAKDQYCTLSTGQYWDWLTYIDVSRGDAVR